MSIKGLRQDPVTASAYFKLMEENNDLRVAHRKLDNAVKSVISFLSKPDILNKPTIVPIKKMLCNLIETQTA